MSSADSSGQTAQTPDIEIGVHTPSRTRKPANVVNWDDSSNSSLTELSSDAIDALHSDSAAYEYLQLPASAGTLDSVEEEAVIFTTPKKRSRAPVKSPFFASPASTKKPRPPPGTVSCIPFPVLTAQKFGLIQEVLAHDPFQLLIAVTFLNRTRGIHSIPIFYKLMERYPTPAALAAAKHSEIVEIIRHLGLQNSRATRYITLAAAWIADPPGKGRRHRKLNYPLPGDGKSIKPHEVISDADERSGAWEIAHLPTAGPYAIDSWRIFCRDVLRGLATSWDGQGAEEGFEPEWKRVVPKDKELRAYLRWMWLREGWEWDPLTGDKEVANEDLMRLANAGHLVWEDWGERGEAEEVVKTEETTDRAA